MSNHPTFDSRWPAEFFQNEATDQSSSEHSLSAVRGKRRKLLIWLFFLTLLSMIWAGMTAWSPLEILAIAWSNSSMMVVRQMILANWVSALLFATSLLSILTAHEMGHYLMTKYYGMHATPPIFIPFPFHAVGTCGALIVMDSSEANRKQMFDIGIAGPIAGLIIAIPVLVAGLLTHFAPEYSPRPTFQLGQPLLIQWMAASLQPELLSHFSGSTNTQLNPFLMAGWAGLLVTGLNMMPMGQLDGGHVAFGIFGKYSIYIAYLALIACILFIYFMKQYGFILMLILVMLIGLRHPPSRDDTVKVGWFRTALGLLCLSLPVLCIPAIPFTFLF